MEADYKFCCTQIDRLGVLDFPPTNETAMSEMYKTLHKCARSRRHAEKIIDAIIEAPGREDDGIQRWPKPDRIRAVAWSLLEERDKQIGCHKCNGTGFISGERVIGGVAYECSNPCSCRPAAPPEETRVPEKRAPEPALTMELFDKARRFPCSKCADLGRVHEGGRWVRCTCEWGREVTDGALKALNLPARARPQRSLPAPERVRTA